MPNYTYECQDCSCVFNIRASIKEMEQNIFSCERCGSKNIKRKFDGFGYCKGSTGYSTGSSGCASCSGGSCSTCHH
ncbi:MAG: zinc ribbon domain-containing protein [Candidatus Atribacteria bacterium]|nr:zinc ribbon domain-containing protein [Candidatus Atribacteria bacterium]